MANLTSEDVRKLIEASSWKHPYSGHDNEFILPVLSDLGVRWTAIIKLIDAEGDKAQRLVILSSIDSVPEERRQKAYELCNKWANGYSYVQTWFSEEDGKIYISAAVESPGDLPKEWLVDSFVNQSLDVIVRFWSESFVELGGLDKFNASQKTKAGSAPESGAASLDEVRKAAELGDAKAQLCLGEHYAKGRFVEKDLAEAVKWFLKAAEQGNAEAQYNLGDCYFSGNGVEKDINESLKWFCKAAEHENDEHDVELLAQTRLGQMYDRGDGVAQDHVEAAKWLRKASDRGFAKAQSLLGVLYLEGNGVVQDHAEAFRLFHLSAEHGCLDAQINLGIVYAKGYGVSKDLDEAMKWFRKAADQGNAVAAMYYQMCLSQVAQRKTTALAEKTSWKVKVGWACVAALILLLIVVRIIIKS